MITEIDPTLTQARPQEQAEGRAARAIGSAKIPSDVFLWAALGSIATSLGLKASGRHEDALFVGQWAPTFLVLGLYNKLMKAASGDRSAERAR